MGRTIGLLLFLSSYHLIALQTLSASEKTSASFKDTRSAVNLGGNRKTSTNFQEDCALGELSLTTYTSTSFRHRSGLLTVYYYPGTISDITATTGPYAGSVRLTWTAPGADGSTAVASGYVVKWDTKSFTTQAAFESATSYIQAWGPKAPTGSESYTLTGLDRDTTLYIRIEARDADKNQGYISPQASTVTPPTIVSLTVSPPTYNFGSLYLGESSVTASAIVVTNAGNVYQTYSLRATTSTADTPWSLAASTGVDQANLRAAFHQSRPAVNDFDAKGNDLAYTNQTSSADLFTVDGSSTGVNVDVPQARDLWINLNMPAASTIGGSQDFTLTITAEEQP